MAAGLRTDAIGRSFPTCRGDLVVLKDVSITLQAGEAVAIMGPSGSGKSTLLNILGTLDTPSTGRVWFDECDPFQFSERELARFRNRRIGFVFQEHHLLPQCSALENVLLPTLAAGNGKTDPDYARELLELVGLSDRWDHRPAELSGGERQRVALARALINRPALLLADEPTGNLDRSSADAVATLLLELQHTAGVTLAVVTHSTELAGRMNRRFQLVDGSIVEKQ